MTFRVHPEQGSPPLRELFRTLRPHQWAKNLLLAAPAAAAHLDITQGLVRQHLMGFAAFSAVASATYIANDLIDRQHDRAHHAKRLRPIAAGVVSARVAMVSIAVLVAAGLILTYPLPTGFSHALAAYAATSAAYSFILKKKPIIDTVALAGLYSLRVFAGAALASVSLSDWFLAFFVFLFVALAITKRVAELARHQEAEPVPLEGRGYLTLDVPFLTALGAASAAASTLVYCLYITGPNVLVLYSRPELLWAGFPPLFYWQARMLLLAARGEMPHDPVAFALRDPASYVVLIVLAGVIFLAS